MIRLMKLSEVEDAEIFSRAGESPDVSGPVAEIIKDVRERGDAALREYCERFDGGAPESLEVTAEEFDAALASLPAGLVEVLRRAEANIRAFHEKQLRTGYTMTPREGVTLGERIHPIRKVGLYVPGGTAPLFSSVLMSAVPAKIAGCREIVITTPARGGAVAPEILAAAKIAGVDRVFKLGGAQAIAALAYGTESVPRVDKIVGPGNAYVAEAKRQVFGTVAIDMIAGPSEILILADSSADPALVAADLLSQAEHDKNASAVLVTDCEALAEQVRAELERQIPRLSRREIARASIDGNGRIIVTDDLGKAIDVANRIAPEHMEIYTREPMTYLERVTNAGSVFVGEACPEAVGDYYAGCNHTLPTGGTARFSSPLSVDDFIKKSQFMRYEPAALLREGGDIALFARREGLDGHARSVEERLERWKG